MNGKRRISVALEEMDRQPKDFFKLINRLKYALLERKAHSPLLKETPIGECPNLAMRVEAFGQYHPAFYIDHLGGVLQALGGRRRRLGNPPAQPSRLNLRNLPRMSGKEDRSGERVKSGLVRGI